MIRFLLMVFAISLVPGAIVGAIVWLLSRKMGPTWIRGLVRSAAVAAVITPFGIYLGPEGEAFVPTTATAAIVSAIISPVTGLKFIAGRDVIACVVALALATLAIFVFSKAWEALKQSGRPRLYRTALGMGTILFLVHSFLGFEIYRAQANYTHYPIGDTGWEVRAFAVAIAQQGGRSTYRRFLTDHDYGLDLWMRWGGKGQPPEEPQLRSATLIGGNHETHLVVAKSRLQEPTKARDGTVRVAHFFQLAPPHRADDERPQVRIPWRHREVEVKLSYGDDDDLNLLITLTRNERFRPHYSPPFPFKMGHPFRALRSGSVR